MSSDLKSRQRANRALDAANFFLADVRDGLGPYLAVYLLTEQKWDEASIGVVMSIASFAGIVTQTPAGAVVDTIRAKRLVMVCAALIVTCVSLILPLCPGFWPVAVSQGIAHAAGAIFTIPAFYLVKAWPSFDAPDVYWKSTALMLVGSVLGVLFVSLIRRVMVEDPELPFPESVAASEVHKAGQSGAKAAK